MDAADLRDWAIENEIHPHVLGFLVAYGALSDHGFIYVSLVNWKKVSDLINDDALEGIPIILGGVGGAHFERYLRLMDTFPSEKISAILAGERLIDEIRDDPTMAPDVGLMLFSEINQRIMQIKSSWGSDFKHSDAYQEWLKQVDAALTAMHLDAPVEILVVFLQRIITLPLLKHEIPNLLGLLDMYADNI